MRRSSAEKERVLPTKRSRIHSTLDADRVLYNDIQKALKLVLDGTILRNVVKGVGTWGKLP